MNSVGRIEESLTAKSEMRKRKMKLPSTDAGLASESVHHVRRQAQAFWPSITIEEMQNELEQIQQFVLLYPAQGAGPYRTVTAVSTQSLVQKGLADTVGLQQFGSTPVGNTTRSWQIHENSATSRCFWQIRSKLPLVWL